jgi:hypothetical protein
MDGHRSSQLPPGKLDCCTPGGGAVIERPVPAPQLGASVDEMSVEHTLKNINPTTLQHPWMNG